MTEQLPYSDLVLRLHSEREALKLALEAQYSSRNPLTRALGQVAVSYRERAVIRTEEQLDMLPTDLNI